MAGTLVLTGDGLVPIEQIATGDTVVALDVDLSAATVVQKVTGTVTGHSQEIVDLDFGVETVSCTPAHRFYTGSWTPAAQLNPGTWVLGSDGTWHELYVCTRRWDPQPVYNLEVQEVHAYLVGSTGLLVHNIKITEPVEQAPEGDTARSARSTPFTPKKGRG